MICHSGGGRGKVGGGQSTELAINIPAGETLSSVFFFFLLCRKGKEESGDTSASESGSEILYCLQVKQEITRSTGVTHKTVHVMCLK